VAFRAILTGGTSNFGIFSGFPGVVSSVALSGQPAPGAGGANYNNGAQSSFAPVLNGTAQVAFAANLTDMTVNSGIFSGPVSMVSATALAGQSAPGTGGSTYSGFGSSPSLNGSGQLAFTAGLFGGGNSGVFAGSPGSITAVAIAGQQATGAGSATYQSFTVSLVPVLNGLGQVAFATNLQGGTANSGIFVGSPGSVSAVALQGEPAPGAGTATYADFGTNNLALNGSGQVAFSAVLAGPGVTTANDAALFAGIPGAVQLVVRKGDTIDVDPGGSTDFRTISAIAFTAGSGGQDGRGASIADNGTFIYRLNFTDGTSGVFTSVVPVPEPAFILAMAGMLAIGHRMRRRRLAQSGEQRSLGYEKHGR
jgi:hypothetical protein